MQAPKDKDIFSNNNSIDNTLPDQIPPNSDNIDKNDSNPDNTPKPSNINKFIKNPNPQNNVPSNEGPAPGIMGSSTGQIPQKINDPRVNPISSSIYNPLIGGRNSKKRKKEDSNKYYVRDNNPSSNVNINNSLIVSVCPTKEEISGSRHNSFNQPGHQNYPMNQNEFFNFCCCCCCCIDECFKECCVCCFKECLKSLCLCFISCCKGFCGT